MNTIIAGKNVVKSFGKGTEKRNVLDQVSVAIHEGEFVAVMGPSGSGKSTLMFALSGMDRIDDGEVTFDGMSLATLSEDELETIERIAGEQQEQQGNANHPERDPARQVGVSPFRQPGQQAAAQQQEDQYSQGHVAFLNMTASSNTRPNTIEVAYQRSSPVCSAASLWWAHWLLATMAL